jgi:hypothetical protein
VRSEEDLVVGSKRGLSLDLPAAKREVDEVNVFENTLAAGQD